MRTFYCPRCDNAFDSTAWKTAGCPFCKQPVSPRNSWLLEEQE